ncbi:MAG: putative hydrolases or acyltransferases (alpha/beta hydrolase superfamily) [Rhodobacteraceae bacterium HLUCCO07]|nr:MAG: putative hydrolases or acyltransferases (alpha/beta hydrolase superfamily) [Rhodobacteraceae bacterium HLUCCO07]
MKLVLLALALLAIFVAITLWKARAHEARAVASHPPEGRILTVDGHRVHAVVMGPDRADAPDLVLIHGLSGNTRDFTHSLAPALAARYRVIIFDRPGLGHSERINRTGATITQQADLLSRAAQQLGAERPIVLGHSYGGAVALAWAVRRPETLSALVLLSAPSQPWQRDLGWYYRLTSHPVVGPLLIPLITAYAQDSRVSDTIDAIFAPQDPPPGYASHVGAGLTLHREALRTIALQRVNLLSEITALQRHYPQIDLPVESVHGTADTTVGLDIHALPLTEQIDGARLARLDGIGHMPQHVAQPEVIAAIDRAATRAGLPSKE